MSSKGNCNYINKFLIWHLPFLTNGFTVSMLDCYLFWFRRWLIKGF
uniref:Uncharacterized protein n=1 Tax=Arundo donax TaxID=35708 RepID=A0A0A9H4E7_ARUDO